MVLHSCSLSNTSAAAYYSFLMFSNTRDQVTENRERPSNQDLLPGNRLLPSHQLFVTSSSQCLHPGRHVPYAAESPIYPRSLRQRE